MGTRRIVRIVGDIQKKTKVNREGLTGIGLGAGASVGSDVMGSAVGLTVGSSVGLHTST
jgi:hypothetical protein